MRDLASDIGKLPSATASTSRLADRLQYPLLALLLLVFLGLGWRGREPINIGTSDENTYVSLSQAMATGSYRETHLASAPLHVKYPPAYPAFLLGIRIFAGDNLDVARAVNLALLAMSILFMYLIVRQVTNVWVGLSLALLLAINNSLLNSGGTLLSESLFVGLGAAALWLAFRAEAGRERLVYGVIALALLTFLTRAAGIALVAGVGIWLLGRRKKPELIVYFVASLLVVGGWFLYVSLVPHQSGGESYTGDVIVGLGRSGSTNPVMRIVRTALRNMAHYGSRTLPNAIGLPTIPGTSIDNLAWLAANTVFIAAGIVAFWKRARLVAAYLVLYAGLLLAWPWLQGRLLVPMVPLVLSAILVGAYRLAGRLPPRARSLAVAALVLLLGVGGLEATLRRDVAVRKCDRSNPYVSTGCFDSVTRGVGRAAEYLRDRTPADRIVMSLKAVGVNYVSGHPTELPLILYKVPPEGALARLREYNVHYVLMSGRTSVTTSLATKLLPSCRSFGMVQRFSPDVFLMTTEAPVAPSGDACAALADQSISRPMAEE